MVHPSTVAVNGQTQSQRTFPPSIILWLSECCTCQSSALAQPKVGVAQTCVHPGSLSKYHRIPHALGHLCRGWSAQPSRSPFGAVLEAGLFQIRRKQKARAGCRFAEIRAILVQTDYVLLIGRINEPGCSSIAIRNNTTTILVPFLFWAIKQLISSFYTCM